MPDPLRIVDLDKSARHFAAITNIPTNLLFTDQEVMTHDRIRQKAMQQAQAPQQAMAAVTAAKTLSDTNVGDSNNALTQLLGGGGGGGAGLGG